MRISAERAAAAQGLFTSVDPGLVAQKQAQQAQRQASDREKAAELARQRAECAVASAAHQALPDFCATIK